MREPLSRRQWTVLGFVRLHLATNGYPPTVRELAEAVHLQSASSVVYHLRQLEAKGYLRRVPRTPRAIVLSDLDRGDHV